LSTRPMIDVSIIVISHNDEGDLPLSVGSALAQRGVEIETIVVDNASCDGSRALVEKLPGARVRALPENVGFAAAMNLGIEATTGRYVLALNPDCRLEPDFASVLTKRLDSEPSVGSASGRILRARGSRLEKTDVLDSAGIRFTAAGRHFDRGSGQPA